MVVCCACRGDYQPEHQLKKSWLHKLLIFFSSFGASGSEFLVLAPLGQVALNFWYLLQLGRDLQAQTNDVLCCAVLVQVQSCCWNYNGQSGIWLPPVSMSFATSCTYWGTFARCYIMMHIYGIAAGQWDLILRRSRQRGFRLGNPFRGFLFPTSSMPNRATFSRSSLLLPICPMRRSSTSVQHNGEDSSHLNQSQCHCHKLSMQLWVIYDMLLLPRLQFLGRLI